MKHITDIIAAGGLVIALGGCALFTPVNTPDVGEAARAVSSSIVPASVSWPLAVGSILLTGAAIFTWVALGNRRRALLMIAAAVAAGGCYDAPGVGCSSLRRSMGVGRVEEIAYADESHIPGLWLRCHN